MSDERYRRSNRDSDQQGPIYWFTVVLWLSLPLGLGAVGLMAILQAQMR